MAKPELFKDLLHNKRSRAREAIFFNKISYDLKVAAVDAGCYLQIASVEVDDEGIDAVADWGFGSRKLQFKTRDIARGAKHWDVQAGILKPTFDDQVPADIIEWQFAEQLGANGGILLVEIDWSNLAPKVRYLYSDLYILMLLRDGVIAGEREQKRAKRLLTEIYRSTYSKKVKLTPKCFVRPASMQNLLEFAGIPSGVGHSWRHAFMRYYSTKHACSWGVRSDAARSQLKYLYDDMSEKKERAFLARLTTPCCSCTG